MKEAEIGFRFQGLGFKIRAQAAGGSIYEGLGLTGCLQGCGFA